MWSYAVVMSPTDTSPTARALLALELIQGTPGITAGRLAERLGVTERAARRYVAILREAGIPLESERGPYGGYRVGRGLRLPPLMFEASEALALVMAVLDGHHEAADAADPAGSALGKIIRALPAAGRRAGRGRPPGRRTGARPRGRPAEPADHHRPRAGQHRTRPGPDRLPHRGGSRVVAGGRPLGRRGPPRPVVPALLEPRRRRPAGLPHRPRDRRRGARRAVHAASRARCRRRARDPHVGRLGVRHRGRHRRAARDRDAMAAARTRPARGGSRGHHPAGRQHQQPRLVCRAAGRPARPLPHRERTRTALCCKRNSPSG